MANQTDKFNTATEGSSGPINGIPETNWGKGTYGLYDADGKFIKSVEIDSRGQAKYTKTITAADLGAKTLRARYTGDAAFAPGGTDQFTLNIGDGTTAYAPADPWVKRIVAGPGIFISHNAGNGVVTVSTQPVSSEVDIEDFLCIDWTRTDYNKLLGLTVEESQFTVGGTNGIVLRSRNGIDFTELRGKINSSDVRGNYVNISEIIGLQSSMFTGTSVVYFTMPTGTTSTNYFPRLKSYTEHTVAATGRLAFHIEDTLEKEKSLTYFGVGNPVTFENPGSASFMFGEVVEYISTSSFLVVDITNGSGQGKYSYWTISRTDITFDADYIAPVWGKPNNASTVTNIIMGDGMYTVGSSLTYNNGDIKNQFVQSSGCYHQSHLASTQTSFTATLFLYFNKTGQIYRSTAPGGVPCFFDDPGVGGTINPNNTVSREYSNSQYWFWQNTSNCEEADDTSFRVAVVDKSGHGILYSNREANANANWTAANKTTATNWGALYAIAYGNSKWIAAGDNDTIWTSDDGASWTLSATGTGWAGSRWRWMAYGNNKFVVVGQGGRIAYTEDNGATWIRADSGTNQNLNGIAYSLKLNRFVAVGDRRTIVTVGA